MTMTVAALWRYPGKTLAGEPMDTAELTHFGIPGDRVVHVRGPEGVRTSRRHHRLLGLHATLGSDGEPLINGLAWSSSTALELVRQAVIDLDSLRRRCPMTTVDPDTLERDRSVLLDINHRFAGKLALDAEVTTPGTIHVGDDVTISRPTDWRDERQ